MKCSAAILNVLLAVFLTTVAFAQKSKQDPNIISANELVLKGEYERALDFYNKAIECSPRVADYYNLRGYDKDLLGDFNGGIADFDKAISLDKKNVLAYNNRGYAFYTLNKDQQALKDYSEAIKLKRDFIPAYSNRALVYTKLTMYNEALSDLNIAILGSDTPNSSLHNLKGYCLYSTGKGKLAIVEYTQAIKLDSEYADAYYNRGVAKFTAGDVNGAYGDFIVAKRIGHPDVDTWLYKYKLKKTRS